MGSAAQKLKNYRLIAEVGAGGLGRVFRAVDERTGRTVAIKILHKKYQLSKRFLGIFHRELLIVSRLRHKHIVEFIDSNFDPPECYIVSEFVDGWSLHTLQKHFGRLPPLVALSITIDMLQGIDYLHLHDTIHSDLSSPNVMVDKSGRVLVMDFGLACQEEVEDYKNYMVGTPGYYSPEHISDSPIVPQSDLYCVGLLLYEMLTGKKAVPAGKSRHEIMAAMKDIDFSRIVCSDKKMESLLRSLLKKTLKVNPTWRIKSAERMLLEVFKILRRYKIRYARYAIHQFLMDKKMAPPTPLKKPPQNIYYGFHNNGN